MQKTDQDFYTPQMMMVFALLLLPLLDSVYQSIFEKHSWRKIFPHKNTLWTIVSFLGILGFLYLIGIQKIEIYLLALVAFFIYMRWDARVFFAAALGCLCFVVYLLLLEKNTTAEMLSIFVYYFLLAGVVGELGNSFRSSKHI